MNEILQRLSEARARMERGGKYAKDLRRQIIKNGGMTDAEEYAIQHLEALIELYRRAGLDAQREKKQLKEVRAYAQRIKADAASAPAAPDDHPRRV